jgi:hypothetical protein
VKPPMPCTVKGSNCRPIFLKRTPAILLLSLAGTCRCAPSCSSSLKAKPSSIIGSTRVNSGIYYTRDDLIGLCKFAGTPDRVIEPAFQALYGVEVTRDDMMHATQRTYLRGLLPERKQGTTSEEYVLPARTYERNPYVQLPHFITPAFWQELRSRVFEEFDKQIASYGLHVPA